MADLPDAVEDGAMALIGRAKRPFTGDIWRDRERDFLEIRAAQRLRILRPEAGEGVGDRPLPVVAHPLPEHGLQPAVIG